MDRFLMLDPHNENESILDRRNIFHIKEKRILEKKEMHDKNGSFLKIRDFSMNRLLILNL